MFIKRHARTSLKDNFTLVRKQIRQFIERKYPDIGRAAAFVRDLSPEDKRIISDFQQGHQMIRGSDDLNLNAARNIMQMDSLFNRAPKSRDYNYFFRGLHVKTDNLNQLRLQRVPTYQSTSVSRTIASTFAKSTNSDEDKEIILMIRTPKGTPFIFLGENGISSYADELEVVLPRCGSFVKVKDPKTIAKMKWEASQYHVQDFVEICELWGIKEENLLFVDYVRDDCNLNIANDLKRSGILDKQIQQGCVGAETLKKENINDFTYKTSSGEEYTLYGVAIPIRTVYIQIETLFSPLWIN